MSSAIAELFDPIVDPVLASVAYNALLAGLEASATPVPPAGGLWGVIRGISTGPDFLLVDEDHQVRVVVEHKRGAAAQVPAMRGWRGEEPFDDDLARAVAHDLESVPPRADELHMDSDCSEDCRHRWHTQRRGRMFRVGLWQIDAYRTYPRWLREGWELSPPLSIASPNEVVWLVLDRENRSAADAFPGALTGGAWQSTGYMEFVRALTRAHADAMTAEALVRADTLSRVIRMAAS